MIADRIKSLREQQNRTQSDLAKQKQHLFCTQLLQSCTLFLVIFPYPFAVTPYN